MPGDRALASPDHGGAGRLLVTGSGWLLAVQAVLFAVGAAAGVRTSPYGRLFRTLVRPRIGPPAETEDPRSAAFRAGRGAGVRVVGLSGTSRGPAWLGLAATLAPSRRRSSTRFSGTASDRMYLWCVAVRTE